MTDIGGLLLIAASCLVLHLAALMELFEDFGAQPEDRLARVLRRLEQRRKAISRLANALVAGAIALVATGLMMLLLMIGGYATLVGMVELALAGAWVALLEARRRRATGGTGPD